MTGADLAPGKSFSMRSPVEVTIRGISPSTTVLDCEVRRSPERIATVPRSGGTIEISAVPARDKGGWGIGIQYRPADVSRGPTGRHTFYDEELAALAEALADVMERNQKG